MNAWDVWQQSQYDSDTCSDCIYGHVTRDPYSTGDSPSMVECLARAPEECPDVVDYESTLEDLTDE